VDGAGAKGQAEDAVIQAGPPPVPGTSVPPCAGAASSQLRPGRAKHGPIADPFPDPAVSLAAYRAR
jgi:hypothetical protein